ncbi:hemagglutinin repeat-containing protein [Glaciimonas sp. PAMC28666]|uniref:hemagglutinin repeat-containing protein n=1 Tax=Glaciimonas sp. PAMC28666 TaxID=2807626 RepID=UPI001965C15E|nr:hemagglutinin repeat-containing protein [Glaciimonas sp. PAMC28666]QRX81631.1 hemagglutinin repeat-containing protein [Glaciimonas sp. PAMC28666]
MNKQFYRTLFSHASGQYIAVAENTRGRSKCSVGGNAPAGLPFPLMRFALLAVLVAATFGHVTLVQAQTIAYKHGGPAPMIDRAANGVPVVQIVQPNATGLSHNRYSAFNVDSNGLILNNSPTSVSTTLGGYIQGNAQLNTGAQVILNETLGVSPSHLNGYIEVAGQRADVIVANPNGLSINGFGVINGGHVTLTTGVPQFGGAGSLAAFRVTRGAIMVEGGGINASPNDSLSLISRSLIANAQIHASRLGIVTGANRVTPDMTGIEIIQGEGGQPTIAIDSSALGGLYANKIKLVGTEAGVGVRTYGDMASNGDFSLDVNGKITLNGHTNAGGQFTLRSSDGLDNTGTLYAQNVALVSGGQIGNSGTIAAHTDLSVHGAQIASSGILAAGIDRSGQATFAGNLRLQADGTLVATGHNTAGGNLTMTAADIDVTGAVTSANGTVSLTATAGNIDHTGGTLQTTGHTTLNASGAIINDGGVINTAQWSSHSDALSNVGGALLQSGTDPTTITTANAINNHGGTLATNAHHLTVQAGSLHNEGGHITQAGNGTLNIHTGAFSNAAGTVVTNGELLLHAVSLDNRDGSIAANRRALLQLFGDMNNVRGSVQAAQGLTASAANIDNTAGRITASGTDGLWLDARGLLINIAGTGADGVEGGVIGGNGDVMINAVNAINSGSITAGRQLAVTIGNHLNNNGGRLAAADTLTAHAAALSNAQGTLDAAKIDASIAQLNNNSGKINADQLRLHATNLQNHHGEITQFGHDTSVIDVTDTLDNSAGGNIHTNSTDLILTPQHFNNTDGILSHAGTGRLTIHLGAGVLDNRGGTLGSNGALDARAATINNQSGTMFGADALTLSATQGDIDNSGGSLSGDRIALQATGNINNAHGKMAALRNGFTVHANSFNNAAGTVQNLGAAALSMTLRQGLYNTAAQGIGGLIGSAGNLQIHASAIDNTAGTLYAQQDVTVQADGTLTNASGVIQSDGAMAVSATGALENHAGRIEANGHDATLTVTASGLDNSGGRIANSGSGATTLDGGAAITNTAGMIGANGKLTLVADRLTNTHGQIIAADDVTLAIAQHLDNDQGKLFAARHLRMQQAAATLTNRAGTIASSGDTTMAVARLDNSGGQIGNTGGDGGNIVLTAGADVINTAGTISSDHNTTITAATLIGDGTILAGQDATLHLQGDYTNTVGNVLRANRDVTLTTTGTLTNAGQLEAVRHLRLSAANVTNQFGALINAGNGNTVIKATRAVYNRGRIYGDDVVIGADTVTNDGVLHADGTTAQAGVIAARHDLMIGAQSLVNREHASLISLNDMVLGGALDAQEQVTGNAVSIVNASASIEAGQDLTLHTANLTNANRHFSTALVADPTRTRRVTQYRVWNDDIWYDADQVSWDNNGGMVLILPDGSRFEKFYKQDYTQIVRTTEVISSDPGQITSGGNMTLSGNVTNDKSTFIAGGTLGGQVGSLNNLGAPGEIVTTNHMTALHNYYHWVSGHPHQDHYTYDNDGAAYDVILPSQHIDLPVWTVREDTRPEQGDNGALGTGVDSNRVPSSDSGGIGNNQGAHHLAGNGQTVDNADGSAGNNTGLAGHPQTVGQLGVPLPNLTIGNSQLFPLSPNPHSPYLVETDPSFTNYRQFLSSDYLLARLGIDPLRTQKRLGDGFYEQKLINDQITQLTGKRFLGDFASNEAQYQALMESGLASAAQWQLTPGTALTAAQMAALTHDMVWLVSQAVTLPDGSTQRVFVPVVYLARGEAGDAGNTAPTGSVMAGRDMDLNVHGTLDNGGTVQATNTLLIHATDLHNTGAIRSDATTGTTVLVADHDLLNHGGSIAGHRVGLVAGRDIVIESVTSTASSKNGRNVGLSQLARVDADQLSMQSGRDIQLTAAAIHTTGDAAFVAGRDLSLTTRTAEATSNVTYGEHNHLNEHQTQVQGTVLQAGGTVTLAAGQDVRLHAAAVQADAALAVAAGRDVNVTSAQQTSSKDQEITTTTHGLSGSSRSHMLDLQQNSEAIGSRLTGNSIAIVSGRDTTIKGSQVTAQQALAINAGRDLNIFSARNTSAGSYQREETQSGFSGGLLTGISYGNSAQAHRQGGTSVRQSGSEISGANVHLISGRDTTVRASAITADRDVGVFAGRNINIVTAANTETSTTDSHRSGTSVGLIGGMNARFTNFSQTAAAQDGGGTSTTHSTSLLSANGGNLTLQAGLDAQYKGTGQGNVTTQGAELLAKNTLTIAGNAVDLQAIHDASSSHDHAESHSTTLGSSLTGTLGGALTRIGDNLSASQHTGNDRLKGALRLKASYDAYQLATGGLTTTTTAAALDPNPQNSSSGGFGVSVNLGSSHSQQDSHNSASQSRGTTVQGRTITVTAREGDITMEGAKLQATDIALDAARNINLIAAKNTAALTSSNSGSSAGIGATLGSNGEQTGLSFQLGASMSKGHASGSETTYDNMQINATNHLSMKSGGDTTLIGAQLAANHIDADIGGNLTIRTLQDQSAYDSKQENGGFSLSLCIPPICVGSMLTGSVNYARQTVDHHYRSAHGQSGIAAGTGGFTLNVKGNTALEGGAITSTAPEEKNTLRTASLTSRDLINQQHIAADSLSAGFSTNGLASNLTGNVLGNLTGGAGMPKSGDATSHTDSVISPSTVTITGTGDATTDAHSQATAETLTQRDAATANETLSNTLTLQQAHNLQAEQQRAQDNQRAADIAGAALNGMVGDIAQKAGYPDGSPQKIALHGIVGLIQAKIGDSSAAGGVAAGMSVEKMSPLISDYLLNNGYDISSKEGLQAYNDMMGLGATLVGAAAGGLAGGGMDSAGMGGMMGKNADANNRQLHPDEKMWIKSQASRYATQKGISVDQALQELTGQADRQVQLGSPGAWDQSASNFLSQAGHKLLPSDGDSGPGFMFYATPNQKANPDVYAAYGGTNKPADDDIAAAINRDQAIRKQVSNATFAAAALAGTGAGIATAADVYAAYKAAAAAYSMGTALGTGMAVGGASYTGSAVGGAAYDKFFNRQNFSNGFDQRFSYLGLGVAMTAGGLTSMYSTAMFGWAGVPNTFKNWVTVPGFVIRINSGVFGKAAGGAAQGAVKSSTNQ